jgi:cysteine synthase A
MVQEELGVDAVVTTVLPDDSKKYLSTDLVREEPVNDGYLTPEVEFSQYQAFRRVCHTCFDE